MLFFHFKLPLAYSQHLYLDLGEKNILILDFLHVFMESRNQKRYGNVGRTLIWIRPVTYQPEYSWTDSDANRFHITIGGRKLLAKKEAFVIFWPYVNRILLPLVGIVPHVTETFGCILTSIQCENRYCILYTSCFSHTFHVHWISFLKYSSL